MLLWSNPLGANTVLEDALMGDTSIGDAPGDSLLGNDILPGSGLGLSSAFPATPKQARPPPEKHEL